MKMNYCIFDYMDLCYNNEDPLIFLLRKNSYETIRECFFMLNENQKSLLFDIIIKERSRVDFAISKDISMNMLEQSIDDNLELLLNLYKNTYNLK